MIASASVTRAPLPSVSANGPPIAALPPATTPSRQSAKRSAGARRSTMNAAGGEPDEHRGGGEEREDRGSWARGFPCEVPPFCHAARRGINPGARSLRLEPPRASGAGARRGRLKTSLSVDAVHCRRISTGRPQWIFHSSACPHWASLAALGRGARRHRRGAGERAGDARAPARLRARGCRPRAGRGRRRPRAEALRLPDPRRQPEAADRAGAGADRRPRADRLAARGAGRAPRPPTARASRRTSRRWCSTAPASATTAGAPTAAPSRSSGRRAAPAPSCRSGRPAPRRAR